MDVLKKPTWAVLVGVLTGVVVASVLAVQRPNEPVTLRVVSIDEVAERLDVDVTNTGTKRIVAWQLLVYLDGVLTFTHSEDLYGTGRALEVNQTVRNQVATMARANRMQTSKPELKVSVIFDDRTAAGPEEGIKSLFQHRADERDGLAALVQKTDPLFKAQTLDLMAIRAEVDALRKSNNLSVVQAGIEDIESALDGPGTQRMDRLRIIFAAIQRNLSNAIEAAERQRR
jgi:hypothetical protein